VITEENIPSVRGVSSLRIPLHLERVEVYPNYEGAGSVVNGYESISGQINTELIKPMNETFRFSKCVWFDRF
jgi:hypothetical protein